MQTSRIISKTVSTVLCVLGTIMMVSAQTPTPPTPPSTRSTTTTTSTSSTTNKRSQQKVQINMDGNKVNLKMNDTEFDLNMVFNFDGDDVIAAITDELGSPMKAGRYNLWEAEGYDIKVKDDVLKVYFDKESVDRKFQRSIQNILSDLFEDLDLDIDIYQ